MVNGTQLDLLGPLAESNRRIRVELEQMYTASARRNDPETSKAAAASAAEFRADHHARILAALATCAGTIYELAAMTGIDHVAVARRLPELKAAGKAEPTGTTRPGHTGRECRVWRAKGPS